MDESRGKDALGLEFLDEDEREVQRVTRLSEEFLGGRKGRWGCWGVVDGDDSRDDGG